MATAYRKKSKEDIMRERGPWGRKYEKFEDLIADLPRLGQAEKLIKTSSGMASWGVLTLILIAFRIDMEGIRSDIIAAALVLASGPFAMYSLLSLVRAKRKRIVELAYMENPASAGDVTVSGVFICPKCGYRGKHPDSFQKWNTLESILWSLFLFPGLLYSLWHVRLRKHHCPACGAEIKA